MSAANKNGFRANARWLVVWAIVAAGALYALRILHEKQRADVQARIEQEFEANARESQNDVTGLEQELRRKERAANTRRSTELEKAMGGPIAAAFKNPAYSLREALQRAATACAPVNSVARADVDRFTEFTVTIDGPTISTNEMIACARKLLPVAKEYLATLQFSTNGTLVAELDRADIEFIDDWATAPDRRIAMLLPRESESRVQQDPAAIERFKNEQRIASALGEKPELREKAERADREFRQAVQNAYGELTLTMEAVSKAAAFGQFVSFKDISAAERELRAAAERLERARAFWSDPAKHWRSLLEANGISGELHDALVNGFSTMFRNNSERTAKVLEAVNGQIESCRYALGLLTRDNDKWKFSGGGIAITDDEFARKFERANRQVREDWQNTQEALRAWHEAVGP